MPGNKKTPVTTTKKRTTASARTRISTKKARKTTPEADGSYIQEGVAVSTVTVLGTNSTSNEAIVSLLQKLDESNKLLSSRMDRMEQRSSFNSTPVLPRSHRHEPHRSTTPLPHTSNIPDHPAAAGAELIQHPANPQMATQLLFSAPQQVTHTDLNRRDAIVPNLDIMRRMPSVTDSVNNILAAYEQRGRQEVMQGKGTSVKKSGRYNTVEIVNVPPHLRWPNEGYHGSSSKKRIAYDDLSFPQWVSGQLTNIYNIQDPNLAKQALLQVIMSTRDAASLPWPVVRKAWAVSIHEVEEGSLDWSRTTQWSLNRLSTSQLAMASGNNTQPKKPCKFYNDGSCSHEGNHGNYLHVCSFCNKQGRNLGHQESRCMFKARAPSKQNAINNN